MLLLIALFELITLIVALSIIFIKWHKMDLDFEKRFNEIDKNGNTVQTCKFRCDAPANWERIDGTTREENK